MSISRIQLAFAALLVLAIAFAFGGRVASARDTGRGEGVVELEFWTLALSPWFDDYLKEQIGEFERLNPGIRVHWVDVPYTALDRKLIAAAAAGRAPDVVNMPDLSFARFVSFGAFRDLTPLIPEFTKEAAQERYLEAGLSLCRIADEHGAARLMGLPWYLTPQAALLNQELLRAGGLDAATLPLRWSELVALAPAFHQKTGKFLISQPLGTESQLPIMMLSDGISPVRPAEGGGLVGALTSPEAKRFLRQWVDLYRVGALPRSAATVGHSHLVELFQGGELAVVSTGPSFVRRIASESPRVFSNTVVRRGVVGALNRVHDPIMVIAVSSGSSHPVEAAKLAWFVTSPAAQTAFCRLAPIMPSTRASLDDVFFREFRIGDGSSLADKLERARQVSVEALPTAVGFTPALACWPEMRRVFEDAMKHVLLDGADLDQTLLSVEGEWNEILAGAPAASMSAIPLPGANRNGEALHTGTKAR